MKLLVRRLVVVLAVASAVSIAFYPAMANASFGSPSPLDVHLTVTYTSAAGSRSASC